jgi:hypothetical protein
MDVAKAFITAREWAHGLALTAFYQSGQVLTEAHRECLIGEIVNEINYLKSHYGKEVGGNSDVRYGKHDKWNLDNLKEVVETAQIGEQLKAPISGINVDNLRRIWEQQRDNLCQCPACVAIRNATKGSQ